VRLNRKFALFIIFVLLLAVIGKVLLEKRKRELLSYPTPKSHPVALSWSEVKRGFLAGKVAFVGRSEPVEEATLSTKVSGLLLKLNKREGDRVKAGEVVAVVESSDLKHSLEALKREASSKEALIKGLKAQLEAALVEERNLKREYERELFLYKRGAVPKEALEKAESRYKGAVAKVKNLNSQIKSLELAVSSLKNKAASVAANLRYSEVKALKDGVITKVLLHEGSFLPAGRAIAKLFYPEEGVRVVVNLPEEEIREIEVGAKAKIDGKFEGRVKQILPRAAENGLYAVEILTKEKLLPYKTVKVEIEKKREDGLIVPVRSLFSRNGRSFVLVLREGGRVEPIEVKVLKTLEGKALVSGNLREGERVAVGREEKLLKALASGQVALLERING